MQALLKKSWVRQYEHDELCTTFLFPVFLNQYLLCFPTLLSSLIVFFVASFVSKRATQWFEVEFLNELVQFAIALIHVSPISTNCVIGQMKSKFSRSDTSSIVEKYVLRAVSGIDWSLASIVFQESIQQIFFAKQLEEHWTLT